MTTPTNRDELREMLAGIKLELTHGFSVYLGGPGADLILSALDGAGIALVPHEATKQMRIAGVRAMGQDDLQPTDREFADGYGAALSASPFEKDRER